MRITRLYAIAVLFMITGFRCPPEESRNRSETTRDSTGAGNSNVAVDLRGLREQLIADGLYDCCTDPGCMECVRDRKNCSCYVDIRKEDPVCGECIQGYKDGIGKFKLVSIPDLEKRGVKKN